MTPKQPPRSATWILKHFGSGPNNDAVLGDLAEQYRRKDSSLWYWRQSMKAIPVSFFREIRGHQWIAARALLTGWVMWILGGSLIFPLAFFRTNVGFDFEPGHPIASAWSFMWMPALGPASVHREGHWITPFSFAVAVALPLIVGTMCGWLVARFGGVVKTEDGGSKISVLARDRKTGVVLLFAGSIFLMDLLFFGPFILTVGPPVASTFAGLLAANVAASLLGVLFGGGLLRDHSMATSASDRD